MKLTANEVRLGNYHFYHIVDKLDERGEYDEVCQIDAEDFRILENFDCPEYKPIPLDDIWLRDFGFVKEGRSWLMGVHEGIFSGLIKLTYNKTLNTWIFSIGRYRDITMIKYVNHLQNVFFALTDQELKRKL
jgi:hypothetical protein